MSKLKGKKALVVDDEEILRELLVVQLTDKEVEAIEASCANDAIEMLQNQVVDFIISDVRMPNGTGVDLLKAVSEMPQDIKPEIVMMTGFADLTEEEALQMGALKMFSKPFRNKDLVKYLEENLKPNNSEKNEAKTD
ncbi:MAG: response regulator [Bdellovibrionota bacterium]|nr:response regulator [Bdellovibrionota bacterium]